MHGATEGRKYDVIAANPSVFIEIDTGCSIRRRRQCDACGRRFTTYEKVETIPLIVIKKDKNRETYDSMLLSSFCDRSSEYSTTFATSSKASLSSTIGHTT